MNLIGLIFLVAAHLLCGRGILRMLKVQLSSFAGFCLSLMVGIPALSLVPCLVQLLHLPVTAWSEGVGVVVFTLLLSIPLLRNFERPKFARISLPQVYELPFIVAIALLLLLSAWRCFYYPPTSRDMLTGPELLAQFAVKEHTMVSSVFKLDLQLTNNYFKSPYITGLQILYKLFVCPFGQVWLSLLALPFVAWLYTLLRVRVHPLIAGLLLLLFVTIPEVYAYTYLMLYDFSNMVFFFSGFYFLARYFTDDDRRNVFFAALLFGLATYIRTETLVLVAMALPLYAIYSHLRKVRLRAAVIRGAILMSVPVLFYVLCIHVFVKSFVPVPFSVGGEVNKHLSDLSPLYHRFTDMWTVILFSSKGTVIFGYFSFVFIAVLGIDLMVFHKFNTEAVLALYGVVLVYVGLALLGYLLPLMDLLNTTKRGLFKIFPLMLLYMANSSAVFWLSDKIREWTE